MSSVFKWMEKNWPFSSSSDFVCFANIGSKSCPVLHMEIKTSLSATYEIELIILSSVSLDKKYLEKQIVVDVNLFPDHSSLNKKFSGYLTSFSFQGSAYSLVGDNSSLGMDGAEKAETQKNVYSLILKPYLWNADKKNKTIIFHKKSKPSIVESILKPYKTEVSFSDSRLEIKEFITQYQESDFKFAVRLMEESGYFCYYDFSCQTPSFKIKNTKEIGSSSLLIDRRVSLNLVKEIHDDFDFDQVLNLKIFDKSAPNVFNAKGDSLEASKTDRLNNVKEDLESNSSYTSFSCDCSSFKIFSGDYFVINVEKSQNSDLFLISPLSSNQLFFVEKSRMVLAYDQSTGWYVRNYLEGFVSEGTKPEYRLERTTSTPIVSGAQKAYVCGYIKNSLYVNSEGKIKVRLNWIPFKEGSAVEKAMALADARKNKAAYIAGRKGAADAMDSALAKASVEKTKDGVDSAADLVNKGFDLGSGAAKGAFVGSAVDNLKEGKVLSVAGSGLATGTAIAAAELGKVVVNQVAELGKEAVDNYYKTLKSDLNKRAEEDEAFSDSDDFLQDKTAIWSVENSDSRALTGWIPLSQWGGSGNNFGNYSFPRVGQVVSVSFVDGDPDSPIVSNTSYSITKKKSSHEEEMNFPYAVTSEDDFRKNHSHKGGVFTDSIGALKESSEHVKDSLVAVAKNPALILDYLEGVVVPDLIPFQCRKKSSSSEKSNKSDFEKKHIQSSSGNLIIKSYAYDDSHRTNRAGWNEISFFNERYNEALRISSGHYLFLHSRDIVHLIAPKLMKEQLGIRCTTISGNKYEIISGKCNEFYGGHRISYFPGPMARQEVESNDGMAIERLQMEVAGKFMDKISGFLGGEQTFATFLNHGLYAYISLFGDYVAFALGGNFIFTTIVGGFNVNANASSFNILGVFTIVVAGYMTIRAVSKFDVDTLGTIKLTSGNSIHLMAGKRIHLNSGSAINVSSGGSLNMNSGKSFDITSGKSLDLKSGKSMSFISGKNLDISATKSISLKTADLSITASKLSINVLRGVSITSALSFDIKSAKVGITGAIIKLG